MKMQWLRMDWEGYYTAFQCSYCGEIICVPEESIQLPQNCPHCKCESERGKNDG